MANKTRSQAPKLPNELILKIFSRRLNEDFDDALYDPLFIYKFGYSDYHETAITLGCVSRAFNAEVQRIVGQHLETFGVSCDECGWAIVETPTGPTMAELSGVPTYVDMIDGAMMNLKDSLERIVDSVDISERSKKFSMKEGVNDPQGRQGIELDWDSDWRLEDESWNLGRTSDEIWGLSSPPLCAGPGKRELVL